MNSVRGFIKTNAQTVGAKMKLVVVKRDTEKLYGGSYVLVECRKVCGCPGGSRAVLARQFTVVPTDTTHALRS